MKNQDQTEGGGAVASSDLLSGLYDEEGSLIGILAGSRALAKACQDPFDYAMKLRTGEVINFSFATVLNRDWVHLDLMPFPTIHSFPTPGRMNPSAPSGTPPATSVQGLNTSRVKGFYTTNVTPSSARS